MIGNGPEKQQMEQKIADLGLQDVHMLGAISALEASAPYLYAADLMLLPGYVGLAVSHAFSMGLPLITQEPPDNTPFHGPEVESIVHGNNGFIVPRGNMDAMIETIETVLNDLPAFSQNAIAYAAENLTVDNMVDGLMAAIELASAKASG